MTFDLTRIYFIQEGIFIVHGLPRFTNIRQYAKSVDEFVSMIEKLLHEIKKIGLSLNGRQTKKSEMFSKR